MRLKCPNCHCGIELAGNLLGGEIDCPSCGSRVSIDALETATLPAAPPRSIGKYDLIEHVGCGHFGDVWKARDTVLEKIVALKIPRKDQFDAEFIKDFFREARVMAQVSHPQVVQVFDAGVADDVVYIASEFIDGVTLADWMANRRPTPREAAEICRLSALGLHAAHEKGIVHRDLKPSNIMLSRAGDTGSGSNPGGSGAAGSGSGGARGSSGGGGAEAEEILNVTPHIMDFGLAKRDSTEATVAVDGKVLGTPAYMSPEQARGDARNADRRSDVYSLGVILYEMLSGRRPFYGSVRGILHAILNETPPPLNKIAPGTPRDLQTICEKAMAREPAERFATAKEVAEELGRWLRDEPIQTRPPSRVKRIKMWARRNRALARAYLLVSMTLVIAIGAGAYALWPRVPPPVGTRITLDTVPSGATVLFVPIHPHLGEPDPDGAIKGVTMTPIEMHLPPGEYLVIADKGDEGFHEVYRTVPDVRERPFAGADQTANGNEPAQLRPIKLWTQVEGAMARFEGSDSFLIGIEGNDDVPPYHRKIKAFDLDCQEITFAEYQKVMEAKPNNWRTDMGEPFGANPVIMVTREEARLYAEEVGKRLPDEAEYEFAATLGGARQYPWGDDVSVIREWKYGPPGIAAYDVLPTVPPVTGLFSNVAELTDSSLPVYPLYLQWLGSTQDLICNPVVRGGIGSIITGKPEAVDWQTSPRMRQLLSAYSAAHGLGFRCARTARSRNHTSDFHQYLLSR